MSSLFHLLAAIPHRLHWALVLLMAVVIPVLTKRTEKPGEFYPFSNFPMYSRFSPDTYYVFVTDLNDQPIAVGNTFGTAVSNVKKMYDRKLINLKKEAGGKIKKADLPDAVKRIAADEALRWLADNAHNREVIKERSGLRLHQVDVIFKDGRVSKSSRQVGEIYFPGT
jgi:hypothetical protein